VIVPNLPDSDTPAAAFAFPVSGGQNEAQAPLQFDLVGVSMANQ